jgi:hypothetical protein
VETIEIARTRGEVSLEEYVRQRQLKLAAQLCGKRAIYLDLMFWISIRDTMRGIRTAPEDRELLCQLTRVVASGIAFCPISDSVFVEVLKQSDPGSRSVTAQAVDSLSLGVAIIPHELRIGTEIAHFMHGTLTPDGVHPLENLIWTKISYALGYLHPASTAFDALTELAIQKAFFDHMWDFSFERVTQHGGSGLTQDAFQFEQLAARLNAMNREHDGGLRTFKQAYEAEVSGVADIYGDRAAEVLAVAARKRTGTGPKKGSDAWLEIERQCKHILRASLLQTAGDKPLRTLQITAALYALLRWNKTQKLESNDFFDFHHASAAVGYCDAFFTERGLRAMVMNSCIALDKGYDCHVVNTAADAIDYLRSIK